MKLRLLYILTFTLLIACSNNVNSKPMFSFFKKKKQQEMPLNTQILNKIFQDGKERAPMYATPFGGIIFKEYNGKNEVYKLLEIRKDKTEDNEIMYLFELFIIADTKENFKSFFNQEYSVALYGDAYIKYDTYEELTETLGELKDEESFILQHDQYGRGQGKTIKQNNFGFWEEVLNTTVFDEDTLERLTEIDNLEEDKAYRIQKLYWGYGRREKSDKLYECINLQNLSIWEEDANYLNQNITQLENLNILSLSNVRRVPFKAVKQIHKLKHLVSLTLGNVNIVENKTSPLFSVPPKLEELKNLKYLSVSENEISNFEEIAKLHQLKTLDISDNKFSSLNGIENLTELEELYINYNLLTELPEGIRQLKKLKKLSFGNCNISKVPDWIGELTNLEELYIQNTKITTLPESIGKLSNLRTLDIWHNNFTSLPKSLQNFKEGIVQLEYKKRGLYDDKISEELKDFKDGLCLFENDFGLKLMVINELMYHQETLKPKFNVYEFARNYKNRTIDIEKDGYEPIPEVVEYFKNLEIPTALLLDIEDLSPDGGDQIYGQVFPFWGGTTDDFDVKNIEDLKHLPRLKKVRMLLIEPKLQKQIKAKGIAIDPF